MSGIGSGAAPMELISIGQNLARLAQSKPNAPAITVGDETLTFGELHKRSNRMARGLLKLGVKLGDFVTIAAPNSIGFLEADFALWKIGATPQPVSYRLPGRRTDGDRRIGGVAYHHQQQRGRRRRAAGCVSRRHCWRLQRRRQRNLPDAVSPTWKAPTSGGSTGRPKLIVSGTPGVVAATNNPEAAIYRFGTNDTVLMTGPLYHNAPFSLSALAIHAGAHVIVMKKFDADETLRLIQENKVTWLYVVPTMMSRIWRVEGRETYNMSFAAHGLAHGGAVPAGAEGRLDPLDRRQEDHGAVRRHRGTGRDHP